MVILEILIRMLPERMETKKTRGPVEQLIPNTLFPYQVLF